MDHYPPVSRRTRDRRLNAAVSRVLAAIRLPERIDVSEWADRYRRLSAESSAETGSWDTSRTPYLMEPMKAFCDPCVRHIILVASSQVGKSEFINNCIGYIIDRDPGSILFIQPTNVDAREYSRLRIAPMIRDTKCLRQKVADPKSRDSGNTILQKTYPGGILTLCGSAEAHALASKPIRYVFGDERDRWADSAGDEGDPWKLALTRQLTFYNRKAVEVSTPTLKNHSAIAGSYEKGTMERWHSQCPHCGEYAEVVFDNIHFEKTESGKGSKRVIGAENIYYVCPICGGVSTESEIKRAPAKWVADNPDALKKGVRSFWLTSWCSPWSSWRDTIVMYLESIGSSKDMQVVYNTRFGQLWEDRGDIETEDGLLARREDYEAELPDGVLVLTCGVDTQDDRLEFEIIGHGRFGETWGIEKGYIIGKPDTDEVWDELDGIISRVYRFRNGRGLKISRTFIDEGGHFTQEVRQRCAARTRLKIYPIKGMNRADVPYTSPPKKFKIMSKNGRCIGSCWCFELGVDAGKALIMDSLKVTTPGRRYCHFPRREDYGERYFHGLLSERQEWDKSNRRMKWVKIPGHERNEALDCRNYALAACKSLSPDFDAIAQKLKQPVETNPSTPAPRKPVKKESARGKFYNEW